MDIETLYDTADLMVQSGRGILAMDESHPTCEKRFKNLNIEVNEENRQAYRSMLVGAPQLGDSIAGAILFDETLRQKTTEGKSFIEHLAACGIIPGIKVDGGTKPLAGHNDEKITAGLDGLHERLKEYAELGARFAKWRAVITIGDTAPSPACISANAHSLARYAAMCQELGLVPIVEPEVLMDGEHSIEDCYDVTRIIQHSVFDQLLDQDVDLRGIVLKPNMVVAGTRCLQQPPIDEIADMTLNCLLHTVPAIVPGIAFLSGGMSDEDASANLNAINQLAQKNGGAPWHITFSYGRALQSLAMKTWGGKKENIDKAQAAIAKRAKLNGLASLGQYDAGME